MYNDNHILHLLFVNYRLEELPLQNSHQCRELTLKMTSPIYQIMVPIFNPICLIKLIRFIEQIFKHINRNSTIQNDIKIFSFISLFDDDIILNYLLNCTSSFISIDIRFKHSLNIYSPYSYKTDLKNLISYVAT